MEVTFGGSLQGSGRLASFKGMATATYVTVASPDGIFYGKGAILESAVYFESVKSIAQETLPTSIGFKR